MNAFKKEPPKTDLYTVQQGYRENRETEKQLEMFLIILNFNNIKINN